MKGLIHSVQILDEPLVLSAKPSKRTVSTQSTTGVDRAFVESDDADRQTSLGTDEVDEKKSPLSSDLQDRPDSNLAKDQETPNEQAWEQGYADGHRTGLEAGEALYREKIEALGTILQSASQGLEDGIKGTEDAIVEVAFEAITKTLGRAMTTREGIAAIVKEVITHAKDREYLVVRVAPRQVAFLKQESATLLNGSAGKIELVADDRVELGGCLLETSGGSLDGRLEVQLQQLRDTLLTAKGRVDEADRE